MLVGCFGYSQASEGGKAAMHVQCQIVVFGNQNDNYPILLKNKKNYAYLLNQMLLNVF